MTRTCKTCNLDIVGIARSEWKKDIKTYQCERCWQIDFKIACDIKEKEHKDLIEYNKETRIKEAQRLLEINGYTINDKTS